MGTLIAGIDEAGLGPMLGPLTVGACLFEFASPPSDRADLWACFDPLVSRDAKAWRRHMVVCDSKQLYSPSRGIGALEEPLLPFVLSSHNAPASLDFASLWSACSMVPSRFLDEYPWYGGEGETLPLKGNADRVAIRSEQLRALMQERGICLKALNVMPVLEGEFNRLLEHHNNKADAHASCVAAVIARLWQNAPNLTVYCDRLGGRTKYAAMLTHFLKPDAIETLFEVGEQAAYRLTRVGEVGPCALQIHFMTKGDTRSFTICLASMMAKYTRELCMRRFNRYFQTHAPALKPTAGYVTDGRRFVSETQELRRRLALDDRLLIRRR